MRQPVIVACVVATFCIARPLGATPVLLAPYTSAFYTFQVSTPGGPSLLQQQGSDSPPIGNAFVDRKASGSQGLSTFTVEASARSTPGVNAIVGTFDDEHVASATYDLT